MARHDRRHLQNGKFIMSDTNTPSGDATKGVGGRFSACTEFVPTSYGDGYWNLSVTDSMTGDTLSTTLLDPASQQSEAQRLAQRILTMHKQELAGQTEGFRFDVPAADEENSEFPDNSVEDATEGEG